MHAHATMNRIFRLVWSEVLGAWVAVAENAKGKGKGGGRRKLLAPALAALGLSLAGAAHADAPLPVLKQLSTGSAYVPKDVVITTNDKVMTITQTTQRAVIDWQTFNVAQDAKVHFEQKDHGATLNRVLDTQPSQILGKITATGQVFLSNPNGVYFGKTASVDVGSLVATTHSIDSTAFLKDEQGGDGSRWLDLLRNGATGAVVNDGTLTTNVANGYIALLAPEVRNSGTIIAPGGSVSLVAGDTIKLKFADDRYQTWRGILVEPANLQDLVAQKQAVVGADGVVVLSPVAAAQLRGSVVNSGNIDVSASAASLTVKPGGIWLHAAERVVHSGKISADGWDNGGGGGVTLSTETANPNSVIELNGSINSRSGKNDDFNDGGGYVSTSAAHVRVGQRGSVNTRNGHDNGAGAWYINSADVSVGAGGDQAGAKLGEQLEQTSIELSSSGSININDAVTWSAPTRLTLTAADKVNVNAAITANGAYSGITINPKTANGVTDPKAQESFVLGKGGKVSFPNLAQDSVGSALVIGDTAYTVIKGASALSDRSGLDALQGIKDGLDQHYALGTDIDASATNTKDWGDGQGFAPIGNSHSQQFKGTLNGLGHTINKLTITRPSGYEVGLFGSADSASVVRDISLTDALIEGGDYVGALAGKTTGHISNIHASGKVMGVSLVGGLVGVSAAAAIVENSSVAGTVSGNRGVGGLIGVNTRGRVSGSGANSIVSGNIQIGGLVGVNDNGMLLDSYAEGSVSGSNMVGGLVGFNMGSVRSSYATGAVSGKNATGGLIGSMFYDPHGPGGGGDLPEVRDSYARGTVTGESKTGGLIGENFGSIQNSYATGRVQGTEKVGGLIGYAEVGSKVVHSFWDTDTTGQPVTASTGSVEAYGEGHNTAWLKSAANFKGDGWGWNMPVVWQVGPGLNEGYPCLTAFAACAALPPVPPIPPVPSITSLSVRVLASQYGNVYGDPVGSFTYALYQGGTLLDANALAGLGVTLGGGYAFSGAPTQSSGAGSYLISYASGLQLGGAHGAEYNLTADAPISYVISKRPLNVNGQRAYDGGTGFALSMLSASNLVNGDCAGGLANCGVSGSASVASKNVGTQALNTSNLSLGDTLAANYTLGDGSATIVKRDVTVTATAPSRTYDRGVAADVKLSTTDSVALADKLAFSHTSAGFQDKNVGQDKQVKVAGISATGAEAGNYNVNVTAETVASITPRDLNVTALGENRVYDGERKAMVSFHDDKLVNDALTVSAASALFADKNAGLNKQIDVAGISLSGADAGNYRVVATTTAHADITPRELNVKAAGIDRKFDGGNAADVTLSDNRLAGDQLTLRHGAASFNDAKVGEGKTVRVSGIAIDGADAGNYKLASTEAGATAGIIAVAIDPAKVPQVPVAAPAAPVTAPHDSAPLTLTAPVAATAVKADTAGAAGVARIADRVQGADTPVVRVEQKHVASGASDGLVTVEIPAALLKEGKVNFGLGKGLSAALAGKDVLPTLADGYKLPDWLRYTGEQSFDISAAPAGALPIKVKFDVDGRSWVVEITEGPSA